FVASLLAEIALAPPLADAFPADTIYLGGGTPSLLACGALARILEALRARPDVRADAWIHLEANPEDVTPAATAAWRALGVATLSLGVQALDRASLAFLGRRHGEADARRSIELALAAGFATVSVDLIYALPDQDPASWSRTLDAA